MRTLEQLHRIREIKPELFEHGLYCPTCETFVHSYFISGKLLKEQEELNKVADLYRLKEDKRVYRKLKRLQSRYKQKFHRFNRAIREEMGMPAEGRVIWRKPEEETE